MSGEKTKSIQIIQNFHAKCSQVIVQARVARVPFDLSNKPNKWFNLELYDIEALREEIRLWRSTAVPILPPLVIETFVTSRSAWPRQVLVLLGPKGRVWPVENPEAVLERWVIEFTPGVRSSVEPPVAYKHAIVLMRVLYAYIRLLPAWQLRQDVQNGRLANTRLAIGYRVINGSEPPVTVRGRAPLTQAIAKTVDGVTHGDSSADAVKSHSFQSVELSEGVLAVSVQYRVNASFALRDPEAVLSQQIFDLERTSPGARRLSAGVNTFASSAAQAISVGNESRTGEARPKPAMSFTRPFKLGDAGSSQSLASVFSQASSISRNRNLASHPHGSLTSSSVGTEPVPVPRGGSSKLSEDASSSSVTSRYSSSFAARNASGGAIRRAMSIESKSLGRPHSLAGSVGSSNSAQLDSTSLLASQSDIEDFMKFIDEAKAQSTSQFRTSHSSAVGSVNRHSGEPLGDQTLRESSSSSRPSLGESLAQFQLLRQDYNQLSESMAASMQRPSGAVSLLNKSGRNSPMSPPQGMYKAPETTNLPQSFSSMCHCAGDREHGCNAPPPSSVQATDMTRTPSRHCRGCTERPTEPGARYSTSPHSPITKPQLHQFPIHHVPAQSAISLPVTGSGYSFQQSTRSSSAGVRSGMAFQTGAALARTPIAAFPLKDERSSRRSSYSRSRRLTFYGDSMDDSKDASAPDAHESHDEEEEELLFALSDMPGNP